MIGAIRGDDAGGVSGSAYVFVRSGVTWSQQAELIAGDPQFLGDFGESVSISGDTIVIGAPDYSDAGISSGAAYVFTRSGGSFWSQQAKLTPFDAAASDQFGSSVAIDGDTLVIGAVVDDHPGGANAGSAYVFTRIGGGVWTQPGKLTASDASAGDGFGYSASIDGDTIVIGANGDGTGRGSAYVFVKPGGGWNINTEDAKLTASDAAAVDQFGISVAISGDTVLVGSINGDSGVVDSGSAYVFVRPAGGWTTTTEDAKLTASDAAASDQFGSSVAIDGSTKVVGASGDDYTVGGFLNAAGSAYVLE